MAIRGYHIYKEVCTGTLGKLLQCRREMRNPRNPFAVAVVNNEDIILAMSHNLCKYSARFCTATRKYYVLSDRSHVK